MSDVPPARPSSDRPPRGTQRAHGLAGTGRRYLLTVAALSSLAALPTLAAVAFGTASMNLGAPARSPSRVPDAPPVVVVPDPDRMPPDPRPTPPDRRTPAPFSRAVPPGHQDVVPPGLNLLGAAVQQPVAVKPVRLDRPERHGPTAERKHRRGKPGAGKKGKAQVDGRSIAGWSRPAGPRR